MASLRKLKKVYLSTPNIAFAFDQDMNRILPFLLENIIASETDELIAIEVKKTIIIDMEKEGTIEDIKIIPAWKFLLR
jgi:predicted AAA+ superfamily ATPase